MLLFLLVMMFVLGTIVGSLLNVCIYRLPLEKSILWPGSHCGHCFQPIRWYDNIPLISYVVLLGRCRTCGKHYSIRYFFIELFTGLCFAGLFYLEVVENIHQIDALAPERGWIENMYFPSATAWVVFGYHALLVCFLLVASFCDLDYREIPFSVTVPGTVLGLIGAVIWAWPWPYTPQEAVPAALQGPAWWLHPNLGPKQGLYPWPFWGPLPAWFAPGGNWQTGLATGLAGAVLGTLMLRLIRFLFGLGLGMEALGLGDADLMMMAGSFLGWQPVVAAFFIGVFAGLIFGLVQLLLGGGNMMPFGPSLGIGVVASFLCWRWIGPQMQPLFFNDTFMLPLAGVSCVLMLIASYFLRVLRLVRGSPPPT
jgi:leader peptidase (prepilin peptidase)/N-methyltransferase